MKAKYMILVSFLLALTGCNGGPQEVGFMNPVIQEDLADPTVMRVGDTYYACGSSYNWTPMYPLYKSNDLVNWEQIGNIFDQKPEWISSGFWAPELFAHNGKYYCYYSVERKSDGKHCIGVAVADNPEGPYVDYGVILDNGSEQIDAHVFDDGGQLYMTWKAHGLDPEPDAVACVRLADDGVTIEGESFYLTHDTERLGSEGQCVFKRGDWYYLLYSARGCCGSGSDYEVRVARSRSIAGDWEKCPSNPILSGDMVEVQSMGHGTVVETQDGRLFYLCHAYLTGDAFYLSRRPFLSELRINDEGWVECVTGPKGAINQRTPFKGTVQTAKRSVRSTFPIADDDPSWSKPVADGPFHVLCKRPFSVDYDVNATIVQDDECLKGLVFFGSYDNYVSLAVEGDAIVLRSVSEGRDETLKCWPLPSGDITLTASVTGAIMARFSWSSPGITQQYEEVVGLAHLMNWDSCFRPGICSSAVDPAKSFSEFSIISQ